MACAPDAKWRFYTFHGVPPQEKLGPMRALRCFFRRGGAYGEGSWLARLLAWRSAAVAFQRWAPPHSNVELALWGTATLRSIFGFMVNLTVPVRGCGRACVGHKGAGVAVLAAAAAVFASPVGINTHISVVLSILSGVHAYVADNG